MIHGMKIRLFPNQEQIERLWEHINGARFIWNYGLNLENTSYEQGLKHLSKFKFRDEIQKVKNIDDYLWLQRISSHTITKVCFDLDLAFRRFFNKTDKHPRFKSKHSAKKSFPARQDGIYFKNNYVVIEKVGRIRYKTNYNIPQGRKICKFTDPRISFINNKWILSLGIDCENQTEKLNNFSMGVDLGIKKLAVAAYDNECVMFNNINKTTTIKKLNSKLKHISKNICRKYSINNKIIRYNKRFTKSKNIIKLEKIQRKIHNRLSNIRKNYIHQTTHKLVEIKPYRVVMENLNISGMMKNRHISKALQEQCLYEFKRQMKYKCARKGINFIEVDRFYPSSRTCSNCGNIKKNLTLNDRIYKCDCGLIIDRDYNAAINLMNYSV